MVSGRKAGGLIGLLSSLVILFGGGCASMPGMFGEEEKLTSEDYLEEPITTPSEQEFARQKIDEYLEQGEYGPAAELSAAIEYIEGVTTSARMALDKKDISFYYRKIRELEKGGYVSGATVEVQKKEGLLERIKEGINPFD